MQSAYNAQVFFSRNPQLLIRHFSLSVFQYLMSLFTIFKLNLQCSLDSAGMQIKLCYQNRTSSLLVITRDRLTAYEPVCSNGSP